MDENDNFALVPKPKNSLEKAETRAKRILSGMVADALALANRKVRVPVADIFPVSILFSPEHIIPSLKAKERFAVIREMIAHLVHIGQIRRDDENTVVEAVIKREKEWSTGYGLGYATPRGRVDCVRDIVLVIGYSASGVEFDALDGQPVNLFAMFIIPAHGQSHNVDYSQPHELELSRFGREFYKTFYETHVLSRLCRSNSADEMWSILKPVYYASARHTY